uniref:Lipoprotein releasing system ATP-binding protein LolD n=1 Tax=uncultured Thiotrichaceae bacterium TaxID=298394 RepID=A0A6S6SQ65_9GAMM|nr:MAG: Lipoprotein releasing system ATP-binding protein LolD [uncultured Thiotrichaceae bacterium]
MKNTVIQTRALRKSIPTTSGQNTSTTELLILQDINLIVQAGESVAITGTSGSGKSTLLGLLAGLDSATDGTLELFGEDMTQQDEDQRAKARLGKVGFVFQSFHLLENLTALENVMLPLELGGQASDIRSKAETALQQVGLAERQGHLVNRLSGGEQQRVALARAFVTQPQVLFADEPTGNLDKVTGQEVATLLFRMQQESQTTLILVTHDDTLAAQCESWYRLIDGKLVLVNAQEQAA